MPFSVESRLRSWQVGNRVRSTVGTEAVFASAEDSPHLLCPDLFDVGEPDGLECLTLRGTRFVTVVSTCFGGTEVIYIALYPAI